MSELLDIRSTFDAAGCVVVTMVGEIDISNAGQVESALDGRLLAGPEVILDLCGVGYVDSSGSRAVSRLLKALEEGGMTPRVRVERGSVCASLLALTLPDVDLERVAAAGGEAATCGRPPGDAAGR